MIDYLMGEHMSKVSISANTFVYPMPVTLLGAMVGGKPNFMALGWSQGSMPIRRFWA